MTRKYDSGQTLLEKVQKGIDSLADNVGSTLGPRGRNVILHQKSGSPIITKDGVTVAKFVELEDPFENVGAQIIKQVSEQTNNTVGDGTTTAAVLARAIFNQSLKYLTAGVPPVELKRGIDKAVAAITENLKNMAIPVSSKEDIEHIATISANGDKTIGALVASAVDLAGKDGAVTIEEAKSIETSLDVVEGFRFRSGYISPQFITDERSAAVKYDSPLFLVTDEKIESVDDLLPILEVVARDGRPFVIVAEEIEGQALAALIMNAIRGSMKVAAVKAPLYGHERRNILKDLALSVGAKFVTRGDGSRLRDTKLQDLGTSNKML